MKHAKSNSNIHKKNTSYKPSMSIDIITQIKNKGTIKSPKSRNHIFILNLLEKEVTKTKKFSSMNNYSYKNKKSTIPHPKLNSQNLLLNQNKNKKNNKYINSFSNNNTNNILNNNQCKFRLNLNSEIINNNLIQGNSKEKIQSPHEATINNKEKLIEKFQFDLVQSHRLMKKLYKNFQIKTPSVLNLNINNNQFNDNPPSLISSIQFGDISKKLLYNSTINEIIKVKRNFTLPNKNNVISCRKRANSPTYPNRQNEMILLSNSVCQGKSHSHASFKTLKNNNDSKIAEKYNKRKNNNIQSQRKITPYKTKVQCKLMNIKEMANMSEEVKKKMQKVFEMYISALKEK